MASHCQFDCINKNKEWFDRYLLAKAARPAPSQECNSFSDSDSNIQEHDKHYLWPGYVLAEAVKNADHIIYGRVIGKKSVMVKTDLTTNAEEIRNELTIQVIRVSKASEVVASNATSIVYYEIPAATEGTSYDVPTNLKEGQDVVLIFNL